jgi:hypothetical protein
MSRLDSLLDAAGRSGEILDLEVIDPDSPPEYYRGRWSPAARRTGRFVGRRTRKWGDVAWGYVELIDGQALKWVGFPALDERFRSCDEAWLTTYAVDASRGRRQRLAVSEVDGRVRVETRMPLPMWMERRLLTVGTQVEPRPKGAMTAFDLRSSDADEEIQFLVDSLWLVPQYAE